MGKTKHCKVCGVGLNKNNTYKTKNGHGRGKICLDCYRKADNKRNESLRLSKTIYIERGRYPNTKVAQKLSKSDRDKWTLARTLSTSPRSKIDPDTQRTIWFDSEFDEWKKGRDFFTSSLGGRHAREGYITKTRTRAGSDKYVFEHGEKVGTVFEHTVCTECGHNEVRIDHRGYKYCTKCFVVQEALAYPSIANYEPGLHEEPEANDPIFQGWYKSIDVQAAGAR